MTFYFTLFAFLLGCIGALQGGLNRYIYENWGLLRAVALNALILVVISAVLLPISRVVPHNLNLEKGPLLQGLKWWYFIPGCCGYLMVAGPTYLIKEVGSLQVFLSMTAGIIFFSLLWDAYIEKIPLTQLRVLGSALTILGAILSSYKGK